MQKGKSLQVLMLSLDRGLLGEGGGDAVARHRAYADACGRLSIVVPTHPGFAHTALSENCGVYPTNARSVPGHLYAVWRYFLSIRAHTGIDLIVSQDLVSPAAFFIARLFRIPIIISIHGVWWNDWYKGRGFWHRRLVNFLLHIFRRADAVRVVSEGLKKELVLRGIATKRIHVIPTPVDLNRFTTEAPAAVPPPPMDENNNEPVVFSAGRLEKEKGFDALLRAWKIVAASLPHARLIIAGDGREREALSSLARELGIGSSVFFLGLIPSVDLPPYYHRARVFALASASESFGKVLAEAGAAGLPAVATDTLGARSVIADGETGYIVPQGKPDEFAAKILHLLSHDNEARAMGKTAAAHVAQLFGWEKNIAKLVRLWHQTARHH